jgi:hypothetical protein
MGEEVGTMQLYSSREVNKKEKRKKERKNDEKRKKYEYV